MAKCNHRFLSIFVATMHNCCQLISQTVVFNNSSKRESMSTSCDSPRHKHWPAGPAHFSDRRTSSGHNIVSFTGRGGPPSLMSGQKIKNNGGPFLREYSSRRRHTRLPRATQTYYSFGAYDRGAPVSASHLHYVWLRLSSSSSFVCAGSVLLLHYRKHCLAPTAVTAPAVAKHNETPAWFVSDLSIKHC